MLDTNVQQNAAIKQLHPNSCVMLLANLLSPLSEQLPQLGAACTRLKKMESTDQVARHNASNDCSCSTAKRQVSWQI
jgi:hypothetical protein